jgi:metal-responsive CopG/Arc/MetJ family transcriptional regulator
MVDVISVGISLPKNILDRIDSERGDVSRSRYLRRVIQNTLLSKDNKECKPNCGVEKANQGLLDVDWEACDQASPGVHKSCLS